MEISVDDLSDEKRSIPNPVRTFCEAFKHYRKLTLSKLLLIKVLCK